MTGPFQRLAIVNRGEPAMRAIRAVRELNEDADAPISLIALYTEPERQAMFVRGADEAYCLGPASGYLDFGALEQALVATRADAAWVGWGFVAEHPGFAELCERLGIVFVGPDASAMRLLGDKVAAKRLAEEVDLPVAPWSGGPVDNVTEALDQAPRIGYPLLIKAVAGGGGRGIRRVDGPDQLEHALHSARMEARDAFGDDAVLLEKLIEPARHVEVQVMADGQGRAWAVGVRDCSCQRRNQKLVEESSSPALSGEQERELGEAAVRLVLRAGYRGAATVEFLYQPEDRLLSFMEVNTRLQVEHPVTEAVTGLDLLKLQLEIAAGGRLEGEPPAALGHAIEARINAEDPALGFAPAPGRIALLRLPGGPGIRIDAGMSEGDVIPAEFDSMIAKVIASGRDRAEALARLRRALAETTIVVEGGTTNVGFLLELLARPEIRSGEVDTGWLDRLQPHVETILVRHAEVALVAAAVEFADAETAVDRATFYAFARRGRPETQAAAWREVELRYSGRRYRLAVGEIGPGLYRVTLDGTSVEVGAERLSPNERRLELGEHGFRIVTSRQGEDLLIEIDGVPHRVSRDDGGLVRNLAPAVTVSIPVEPGDEVAAGDVVAVVEIMKMESSLTAPVPGRVREVLVGPNVQVGSQQPLVRIEPLDAGDAGDAGSDAERVRLPVGEQVSADRATFCHDNLRRLEWLVLGYDAQAGDVERIAADLHDVCADPLACDPALVPGEHRLLAVYADLQAVSRPRRDETDPNAELMRSSREHLNAYLRSLDAEAEGLPERFVAELTRALAHYGIEGLDRTPELEEACYRLFLSQRRAEQVRMAIVGLLDRRLEQVEALATHVGEDFREALNRLIAAASGRDQVLADLAHEARFRYFDQPLIEAATAATYREAEAQLARLAADPEGADRAVRINALVVCPRPLAPLLSKRLGAAGPRLRRALLEAMTRRYYRMRELGDFEELELARGSFLTTTHPHGAGRRLVATIYVALDDLPAAAAALAEHAASLPDGEELVADFYAEYPGEPPAKDELAERLGLMLADAGLPPGVKRVVIGVAEPARGRGMSAVDLFTYRRAEDDRLVEDQLLRDLHPEMAERLHLWRYSNFALERLPSAAEDVYLFRGTARENPKEERIFAIAEVRDLTAVRDESGRLTSLPEFERMLINALEGIRRFQAHRKPSRRPQWNRVQLYVWPVIELKPAEIGQIVSRLGPLSRGLGIEMLLVRGRMRGPNDAQRDRVIRFFTPTRSGVVIEVDDPPTRPLMPYDEATERIVSARRRGTLHPAEIVKMVAPAHSGDAAPADQPAGDFVEHDFDPSGLLLPVQRPLATNPAGIVVGVIRNYTQRYPQGMQRVALLGDPTKSLGSLAEPECRRIIAALDLAEHLGVPLEWFAISAGAKIAMDSGTENMDWIAAVLRRIVDYTQRGGELNVVITGINVGAQPYWNAEATMLMHTRGILIMTPDSAMVLTGKQALDYSGGVSAEDNFGVGGYERIMGPNGEAQYWAPDLAGACRLLLNYYEHAYVAPGERFPRRAKTSDPSDRDIRGMPHNAAGSKLARIGDIVSDETNPGRRAPFDIRSVMRATIDGDHPPLERWAAMRDAESAVVWDVHLGGWPVALLGIESRPIVRHGEVPADGPAQWTSGTLFPRSSKKIARALNSVAGRRPVVVLANLAGFDASPESMREWQLEFGAEIGRAVVNFDGPIVFCVISRYHGGAFVVFSQRLNENLETIALEGSQASVIGGAPAAAVVFAREVEQSTARDPQIIELDERIAAAEGPERTQLRAERSELWDRVHSEAQGKLAAEFDSVHSVERAVEMGSVSSIIPAVALRPCLIDAIERGMQRAVDAGKTSDDRAQVADAHAR